MSDPSPRPRQSQEEEPILFFRPEDANGYLSNMYLIDFLEDGRRFNCAEQYFQAAKADVFGDHETSQEIMESRKARKQKALGRKVKGFEESKWKPVAIEVMRRAVLSKFSDPANEGIRQQLLDTGNRLLIEASPWDHFWGCGMSADAFRGSQDNNYPGRNELGKVLMEVRDLLRAEQGIEKAEPEQESKESI